MAALTVHTNSRIMFFDVQVPTLFARICTIKPSTNFHKLQAIIVLSSHNKDCFLICLIDNCLESISFTCFLLMFCNEYFSYNF